MNLDNSSKVGLMGCGLTCTIIRCTATRARVKVRVIIRINARASHRLRAGLELTGRAMAYVSIWSELATG